MHRMQTQRKTTMPELPEVETVKNVLKPYLVGRTITDIL